MSYFRFIAGVLSFAFALTLLGVGSQLSTSTAWSAADSTPQNVNRAMKGDYLQRSGQENADNHPIETVLPIEPAVLKLLDGCEGVVSSIGHTPLAQVAGRCLS